MVAAYTIMETLIKYLIYVVQILESIVHYLINYFKTVKLALSLPGPPAVPILGHVLYLKDNLKLEQLGTDASQLFGSLFKCWISLVPFIWIYEPKHLKIILGTNKNSKKNILYTIIHNFVGEGLITNNGEKWKKNRKLIQPHFNANILETYIPIFTTKAKEFVKNLYTTEDMKITSFINNCVLEILHGSILGVCMQKDSPYRKGEVLLHERILKPWLLLESIFQMTGFAEKEKQQKLTLHSYTKKILLQRKEALENDEPKCLLDVLIKIGEENSDFTDEDIINEAVTFMLAGQDSVGAALAFTLFYLAKYENIQNKVIEEITEVKIDDSYGLTASDLNKMKYLEQVIKESLRLTPSIPIISRILTEDVELDGKIFPAGTNLFIAPFVTHRLPHIYPDPLKFDPDRFSQENLEKLHPYAFVPFSMGPRNCIGYKFALLEMKTVLFYLLTKYSVSLTSKQEDLQLSYRATLRAKGGIWVRLNLRD